MDTVENRQQEIYDYFNANQSCQAYFSEYAHKAEQVAFGNSMHLLQDSTESLWWHRRKGFSRNPHQAYLELWGVMQAVIIQQDSIAEIFKVMKGCAHDSTSLSAWSEIRGLRNDCAGHPAKRGGARRRFSMTRRFGGYNAFSYVRWDPDEGTTYPTVNLGDLLDRYAVEAAERLAEVLAAMQARWP